MSTCRRCKGTGTCAKCEGRGYRGDDFLFDTRYRCDGDCRGQAGWRCPDCAGTGGSAAGTASGMEGSHLGPGGQAGAGCLGSLLSVVAAILRTQTGRRLTLMAVLFLLTFWALARVGVHDGWWMGVGILAVSIATAYTKAPRTVAAQAAAILLGFFTAGFFGIWLLLYGSPGWLARLGKRIE